MTRVSGAVLLALAIVNELATREVLQRAGAAQIEALQQVRFWFLAMIGGEQSHRFLRRHAFRQPARSPPTRLR